MRAAGETWNTGLGPSGNSAQARQARTSSISLSKSATARRRTQRGARLDGWRWRIARRERLGQRLVEQPLIVGRRSEARGVGGGAGRRLVPARRSVARMHARLPGFRHGVTTRSRRRRRRSRLRARRLRHETGFAMPSADAPARLDPRSALRGDPATPAGWKVARDGATESRCRGIAGIVSYCDCYAARTAGVPARPAARPGRGHPVRRPRAPR